MWNNPACDRYQNEYPYKAGLYLLEKIGQIANGPIEMALDLGCGNGILTRLLADSIGCRVAAVDADPSSLEILKETHLCPLIQTVYADIPLWFAFQNNDFDLIFSNAVFHCLGSHEAFQDTLQACFQMLTDNGLLGIRFSLRENAYALKSYLTDRLTAFTGRDCSAIVGNSGLDYATCLLQLRDCGFQVRLAEELRYLPFSNPEQEFQFMLRFQPIQGNFTQSTRRLFHDYLRQCWDRKKVRLEHHHAVFIACKPSSNHPSPRDIDTGS
ncbi:class I SAM-dependent methyltransferase [bacterium]|nr:class I SAM-dependent methyltransferase [bacterium]